MATISVLVNCFNYGRYLADAIDSALAQSVPPVEVIVVDDGSTDDTQKILAERYAGHSAVKVLRQRNGGQLSSVVLGMEHASGELLCFLDADDKYEPDHLENVSRAFAENAGVGFIYTAHRCFGDENHVVQDAPEDLDLGFSFIAVLKSRIFEGSITSTLAIRRNLSLTLLPVLRHIAPRWRRHADDCIIYGAALAGVRKYYLAAPTVLYRLHDCNVSRYGTTNIFDEFYTHGLRRDTFYELLSQHLGFGPAVRMQVVLEFLSIKQPTRNQYRVYVRLHSLIREPFARWLKGRVKIYLHYKRHRPDWDITTPANFHG
jgi:glycosyltransferase involved in cell wall biosynthesis